MNLLIHPCVTNLLFEKIRQDFRIECQVVLLFQVAFQFQKYSTVNRSHHGKNQDHPGAECHQPPKASKGYDSSPWHQEIAQSSGARSNPSNLGDGAEGLSLGSSRRSLI